MAAPMQNTSTQNDEHILDAMAAEHVSDMSRRVRSIASQSDPKNRREPVAPPPPPEPTEPADEAIDDHVGEFESHAETPEKQPTPIVVDLPFDVSDVDVDDEPAETAVEEYQTVDEPVEPVEIEEPPKNLAEEILSEQMSMSDEVDFDAPPMMESEIFEQEDEVEGALQNPLTFTESIEEEDALEPSPPEEDPIEVIAQEVSAPAPTPAPIRPRPAISAIRPPAQPSRARSLFIQALIILLALTAMGMVGYLTGIFRQ